MQPWVSGSNRELIAMICKRLPCQTGGGIRDVARASELLALGAKRVIFGSALLKDGAINTALAAEAAETLGTQHLTFAIDSRQGKVAIQGWKESTASILKIWSVLSIHIAAHFFTPISIQKAR